MKDVTALKRLEQETAAKSQELEVIGEILEVSPRQFGIFMSTAQSLLAECIRLLKANPRGDSEVLKIVFINLHTVKGSARALQLRKLTPLVHEVEQNLAAIMTRARPWDREALLGEVQVIQKRLDQYLELNKVKLGRMTADTISLPLNFVSRLHHTLQVVESAVPANLNAQVKPFRGTIEDLTFVRAETIFREVLSQAEMLARDLHKECPDIVIHDHGIRLSMEGQEFVRKAFLHIIRNSMDHGIETPAERSKRGKPDKGRIEVAVTMKSGRLVIRYWDDGRGLDIRSIRRIARERGLIPAHENLSLDDIAYFIFEPGFSTSAQVNDISGRGVGMNAVREYVEKGNGSVSIRLFPMEAVTDPEYLSFELVVTMGEQYFMEQAA